MPPPPYAPHAAAQLQPIHACGQRALLPVAVGAMKIYDVRNRQIQQTSDSIIA